MLHLNAVSAVLTGPDRSNTFWGYYLVRCAMLLKAPQTDEEADIQLAFQASIIGGSPLYKSLLPPAACCRMQDDANCAEQNE